MQSLAARDAAANDMLDSFDFTQSPRPPLLLTPRSCPASTYLSTRTVAFPTLLTGTTSGVQSMNVQNLGSAPLSISGITVSGDYQIASTCGSSLAVSAACTVSLTFTPQVVGSDPGTLTVTDNSVGSPHTVNLTGTGTVVSLSPTSLAFGNQNIGVTSPSQPVTLTNNGSNPLTITSIRTTTLAFNQTNNCIPSGATSGTLQGGTSCTVNVTFTPHQAGPVGSTVSISDNGGGSPHIVALTGTGVGPIVTLIPGNLIFASQSVGTTSAPQNVTVKNKGNSVLTISSIVPSGDFAETDTCIPAGSTRGSLNPNATCTISVTFTPTTTGTRTGTISVFDNAGTGVQKFGLRGTGM